MPEPLDLDGVTVATDERTGRIVVADVAHHVAAGRSLALVGANGSGKSTLLRCLAGLRHPVDGQVRVGGDDVHRMHAAERGRRIAFVGQEETPPGDIRVAELVALGLTPHRNPWARPQEADRLAVLDALAHVGLESFADRPLERMSGGERRRALLARGLLQRTGVLVLDEPTNHLDVAQQVAMLDIVSGLDRTVVAAVHDLDLAAAWFDDVALLTEGRIVAAGPAEDVLDAEVVRRALGVDLTRVRHPRTGDVHLLLTAPDHPRPVRRAEGTC